MIISIKFYSDHIQVYLNSIKCLQNIKKNYFCATIFIHICYKREFVKYTTVIYTYK